MMGNVRRTLRAFFRQNIVFIVCVLLLLVGVFAVVTCMILFPWSAAPLGVLCMGLFIFSVLRLIHSSERHSL